MGCVAVLWDLKSLKKKTLNTSKGRGSYGKRRISAFMPAGFREHLISS